MGDTRFGTWSALTAAVVLGVALQSGSGRLNSGAIVLLTVALVFATLAVLRPGWSIAERTLRRTLGIGLAVQLGLLLIWLPGDADFVAPDRLTWFRLALVPLALLALAEVAALPVLGRTRMPLVFGGFAAVGAWVIAGAPPPPNDVWFFQHAAGDALLQGLNPYGIEMPNIYADDSAVYAPGLAHDGRLAFGLPYPPLSLLLAMPGYLVGDVRYAYLAVMVLAAIAIWRIRPGPMASGAALIFLFTPRTFFMVQQAWTEPQVVLGLALVTCLAVRQLRFTPLALGLTVAVKQYAVLLVPLAALLRRSARGGWSWWATAGLALLVATAVTLPFALWNIGGFWHSVVEFQILQPFRPDALSYLAWFEMGEVPGVALAGFVALALAAGLVAWRCARTPAGFALGFGFVFLAFVAFNKQAFANYYYLVIGALLCAVAAARIPDDAGLETAL